SSAFVISGKICSETGKTIWSIYGKDSQSTGSCALNRITMEDMPFDENIEKRYPDLNCILLRKFIIGEEKPNARFL
ncbi:MAG: hypothetical protein KGZ49_06495, partial [Syntrophaceae bacterium]|nr:hypothetical protein [Syntrophaceae bacterium]